MSIILDEYGNKYQGQIDQVTGQVITDNRPISANLSAINSEAIIDVFGKDSCLVDLRGAACTLTVVFEGTVNGTDYFAIPAFTLSDANAVTPEQFVLTRAYAALAPLQLYALDTSGFRRVRVRVSAYTSGTIVVTMRATIASLVDYSRPIPSTQSITVTAAAAAGATLTLPAPPAGMFHYITHIDITRNATAALAGTATLVITTTNMGKGTNLAWSVGNAMIAGGTQIDVNFSPTVPMKSDQPGVATTIVMPAPGAAVLWRANATFYVGA